MHAPTRWYSILAMGEEREKIAPLQLLLQQENVLRLQHRKETKAVCYTTSSKVLLQWKKPLFWSLLG